MILVQMLKVRLTRCFLISGASVIESFYILRHILSIHELIKFTRIILHLFMKVQSLIVFKKVDKLIEIVDKD